MSSASRRRPKARSQGWRPRITIATGGVDLYLCSYVYFQSEDQYTYPVPYHDARNGPPNFLFRNWLTESGGFFEDVTAATGMNENNNRYSFAAAWCDFDGDGWPDLYVANDFGRKNLYRNRQGSFRDEAAEAGIDDIGPGMSAAWFDYDGDGLPDLYVSNMWTAAGQRVVEDPAFEPARDLKAAYRAHTNGNSLYRNLGNGKFENVSAAEDVSMGRWAWSADAFDFDNDGSPEIYIAAGMLTNPSETDLNSFFWRQVVAKSPVVAKAAPAYEDGWNTINQLIREDYSWCGREPNVFYKRLKASGGAGPKFYDFSGVSGLDFADDSRAFAVTDIDGDGNLDIVLKSRLAPQVRVLQNNCAGGRRSIVVGLRGTKSNRDAIGARVEVNGMVQYLNAGSGYLSQSSKRLHFGLGEAGHSRRHHPLAIGAGAEVPGPGGRVIYEFTEASQEIKRTPFRPRTSLPAGSRWPPKIGPTSQLHGCSIQCRLPEKRKGPGFLLLTADPRPAIPAGLPFEVIDVTRAPGRRSGAVLHFPPLPVRPEKRPGASAAAVNRRSQPRAQDLFRDSAGGRTRRRSQAAAIRQDRRPGAAFSRPILQHSASQLFQVRRGVLLGRLPRSSDPVSRGNGPQNAVELESAAGAGADSSRCRALEAGARELSPRPRAAAQSLLLAAGSGRSLRRPERSGCCRELFPATAPTRA